MPVTGDIGTNQIRINGLPLDKLVRLLTNPFEIDELKWRAQKTNKDKTKAIPVIYADPRVYIDRLNKVVGYDGWSTEYFTETIPFEKELWVKDGEEKKFKSGVKLIVRCKLTIHGLGSREDVGEEDTSNENVATVAFAQAFKRACTTFGLGRYLYDFPKHDMIDYDKWTGQLKTTPNIPDFAWPSYWCEQCDLVIGWVNKNGVDIPPAKVAEATRNKFGQALCLTCSQFRKRQMETAEPSAVDTGGQS